MEELELLIADLRLKLEAETVAAKKTLIQKELDAALDQLEILKDALDEASPEVATPRDPNEVTITVTKARETRTGRAYIVNNQFLIPVRNAMEFYIGSALGLEGKTVTIIKGAESNGVVQTGQPQLRLATISSLRGMEALAAKESEKTMEFMLQRRMNRIHADN
jgi:hypothetical protein